MKRDNSTVGTIIIIAIILVMITSCNMGRTEEQSTLSEQYFKIEPASLMSSLSEGESDVFLPVSEELELLPIEQQLPTNWHQDDYLFIVDALYDGFLDRTLQDWQLKSMGFSSSCDYVEAGFQNGRFEYFKIAENGEQASRLIRFIDIDSRGNLIHVKETEFYPSLVTLDSIDLSKLKISVDRAFQIAESQGGKERRMSIEDACSVSLGLFPNAANYDGWTVSYTRSDDSSVLFEIQIDPYTGEIHVQ